MQFLETQDSKGASTLTEEFRIRSIAPTDRDWVVATQIHIYQTEYWFDDSFGVLCGQIVDSFFASHHPEKEAGWIAERDGRPVGGIFCMRFAENTAQLRLFFLKPDARGCGLGRRLLQTCMQFAQAAGYTDMRLWTHASHKNAVRLYRALGWQLEGQEAAVSFGQNEVIESYSYRF